MKEICEEKTGLNNLNLNKKMFYYSLKKIVSETNKIVLRVMAGNTNCFTLKLLIYTNKKFLICRIYFLIKSYKI